MKMERVPEVKVGMGLRGTRRTRSASVTTRSAVRVNKRDVNNLRIRILSRRC